MRRQILITLVIFFNVLLLASIITTSRCYYWDYKNLSQNKIEAFVEKEGGEDLEPIVYFRKYEAILGKMNNDMVRALAPNIEDSGKAKAFIMMYIVRLHPKMSCPRYVFDRYYYMSYSTKFPKLPLFIRHDISFLVSDDLK